MIPNVIEDVVIYPIVAAKFSCTQHAAGQLSELGDALGSDCVVVRYNAGPTSRFSSAYADDGSENEDWYGWDETLLAPFDGIVEDVYVHPVTNEPGTLGEGPAGGITFVRADGTRVLYAHIQDPDVEPGDMVVAGQSVAKVGNNGVAWMPHTHVGAWRGDEALQIRFDLNAMGELRSQDVG